MIEGLEARRVMWAAAGYGEGFIDKTAFDEFVTLADVMGETSYRWWLPRYDQPWRCPVVRGKA